MPSPEAACVLGKKGKGVGSAGETNNMRKGSEAYRPSALTGLDFSAPGRVWLEIRLERRAKVRLRAAFNATAIPAVFPLNTWIHRLFYFI